jgi:hypothetical protein
MVKGVYMKISFVITITQFSVLIHIQILLKGSFNHLINAMFQDVHLTSQLSVPMDYVSLIN